MLIILFAILKNKFCDQQILLRKSRKDLRNYDTYLYQERHVIECFFGKVKHFRRVFSRFDKSAQSYLSFLHFVGTLIWINFVHRTYHNSNFYDKINGLSNFLNNFLARASDIGLCVILGVSMKIQLIILVIFFIPAIKCSLIDRLSNAKDKITRARIDIKEGKFEAKERCSGGYCRDKCRPNT